MAKWITVYTDNGRKIKKDLTRLNAVQAKDMADMFRGICLGCDSAFVEELMLAHGNKKLFRHINEETGMRYQVEIDVRRGRVSILAVDMLYENHQIAA